MSSAITRETAILAMAGREREHLEQFSMVSFEMDRGREREREKESACTHSCRYINSESKKLVRGGASALNGQGLLYGPVWENNGRTVSQSCFMGCNCGLGKGPCRC